MPLSDKITNIIGVTLPDWIIGQLKIRSKQGSLDSRNTDNVRYLEGKNAWVRLVSSVNVNDREDQEYFRSLGVNIQDETSLAKEYVLFGGTSKYLNKNSYQLRSGISGVTPDLPLGGQYSPLGKSETQKYGFRPMPGITNVNIETQGRLGSVRSATINFKCWDKDQLDVIDALYFKLGYTMFLEWGQTYFYKSSDQSKILSSELYSINPFEKNLTKEEVTRRIGKNNIESEGNYDAMLGKMTNFNFVYNQEGGYDCTLKLYSLGILAESIKVNNASSFSNILTGTIAAVQERERLKREQDIKESISKKQGIDITKFSYQEIINSVLDFNQVEGKYQVTNKLVPESNSVLFRPSNISANEVQKQDISFEILNDNGKIRRYLGIAKLNTLIPDSYNQDGEIISDYAAGPVEETFFGKLKYTPLSIDVKLNTQKISDIIEGRKEVYKVLPQPGSNTLGIKLNLNNKEGWRQDSADYSTSVFYTPDQKYSYKIEIETDNDLEIIALPAEKQSEQVKGLISGKIDEATIKVLEDSIDLDNSFLNKDDNLILPLIITKLKEQISSKPWPTTIQPINMFEVGGYSNFARLFTTTIDVILENDATFEFQYTDNSGAKTSVRKKGKALYNLQFQIKYTDTDLIEDIKIGLQQPVDSKAYDERLKEQDQVETPVEEPQSEEQRVSVVQSRDPRIPISALEQILRSIMVHSYDEAALSTNQTDQVVYKIDLTKEIKDKPEISQFYKLIFSNGIFDAFIEDLVDGEISDANYDKPNTSDYDKFKVNAKYGFVTGLLSGRVPLNKNANEKNFKKVNFKSILNSYVIRYDANTIATGNNIEQSNINHPVYIPMGQFLMILNSCASLYDVTNTKNKKPIVYIDFNTDHNYCLSSPQQLSIDPWTAMIPFQGEKTDFLSLFPKDLYDKGSDGKSIVQKDVQTGVNYIISPDPKFSPEEIFDPDRKINGGTNGDYVSSQLPYFKYDKENDKFSPYRGKIMNILLNVDYLLGVLYKMSTANDEFKVILKDYIDQILSDLNKALGNYNSFRLSYSDTANCLQIVDDQYIVTPLDERQLNTVTEKKYSELPLLGKESIARSLEIKTEMSTRLSSMVAISANSNVSKNVGGIDGDSVGYINTGFSDRYISDISNLNYTDDKNKKSDENKEKDLRQSDGLIESAIGFNQAVKSIYGSFKIAKTEKNKNASTKEQTDLAASAALSKSQIDGAINYYLERITDVKSFDPATKAPMMIPVSLNFTTDGISGLAMGYAFTIPQQLIPYTYSNSRIKPYAKSVDNKVGFIVTDVNHSLENNAWTTSVKANMIFLKDPTIGGLAKQISVVKQQILPNYNKTIDDTPWSAMFISYVMKEAGVKFPLEQAHTGYLDKVAKNPGFYDVQLLNPDINVPRVGDLVIYSRGVASSQNLFSSTGYAFMESHGDIITKISGNEIIGIGGNVSDSVTETRYQYINPTFTGSKFKVLETRGKNRVFAILRISDDLLIKKVLDIVKREYQLWNNPKFEELDLPVRDTISKYYQLFNYNVKA